MGEYKKPWLTFEKQADLLIDKRGLVADRDDLIVHLENVGYYRLSGYWYIFKRKPEADEGGDKDERFAEGTTFDKIWKLYTFDRQFRLIVLDAIERVEVYFRTRLAYELARDTGAFGFQDKDNLPRLQQEAYTEFIERCTDELDRSREPFAIHFKETYGDVHDLPPYWILVNLMDFGTMLRLYNGSSAEIRNKLAGDLGVSSRVLKSWLVAINTVRNICAHHGRLWNRGIGTRPIIPTKTKYPEWHEPYEVRSDNMFGILTILSYLLERIAPDTGWRMRLFELLSRLDADELRRMGFAAGWQGCPLWKPYLPVREASEMWEYVRLEDETRVSYSDLREDNTVKVVIERPRDRGFDTASCLLPSRSWLGIDGFTDEERAWLDEFINNNASLIMRFAYEGGRKYA